MAHYDISTWTVRDVAEAFRESGGNSKGKKLIVPIFQRGRVWKDDKRKALIDTIKDGFPFGALMLAEQEKNVYSVIDGLQRGTTLCEYVYNPLNKEGVTEVDADILSQIRELVSPNFINMGIERKIQEIILAYLYEQGTFRKIEPGDIADKIIREFPAITDKYECSIEIRTIIKPWIDNLEETYKRTCEAYVPIIIYDGPSDKMSEIFRRINEQGEKLTDYEIYAAVWKRNKIKIRSSYQEVVDTVIKKYEALIKDGYVIDGFDAQTMRTNRELTPFEYLYGLGKYWVKKYDCLKLPKEKKSAANNNEVTEISFEILDVCLNDNEDIANLDKAILKFDVFLLQQRIEEAIEFVTKAIAEVCYFKGNNREIKLLHSKHQIISLIAFTFRQMYSMDDLGQKRPDWDRKEREYPKLLFAHYVADIIREEWQEGGSGKLRLVNRTDRYLEYISRDRWKNIIDNYYQEAREKRQSVSFSGPSTIDKVILNCVYLDTFTARDQLSGEKFDIEHLAPKARMKKMLERCPGLKLPVGCLANLCYLPERYNRKKKDKTIYEYAELSSKIPEIENKYSFTTSSDFEWITKDYSDTNADELEKEFMIYLDKRYERIRERFLESVCY